MPPTCCAFGASKHYLRSEAITVLIISQASSTAPWNPMAIAQLPDVLIQGPFCEFSSTFPAVEISHTTCRQLTKLGYPNVGLHVGLRPLTLINFAFLVETLVAQVSSSGSLTASWCSMLYKVEMEFGMAWLFTPRS